MGYTIKDFALLSVFVFVVCASMQISFASTKIRPGEQWIDDRGKEIQAHGGGIIAWKGRYYWFGEDRSSQNSPEKRYVSCYSSKDLVHWKFQRQVIALADPEHLGPNWVFERPKVFYNARTGRFVLYAHLDDASYKTARVAVAVSDHIDGEYHYISSFRPLNQESRDIGQFIDDDGTAYLIFESRPTHGFFIAKLSPDYLSVEQEVSFVQAPLEGGALVHFRGLYYVVGSHLTGWNPNPNVYATATSLSGPWTKFESIAPPETNTYGAQSTMLLKVTGSKSTTVIFMGDIWRPDKLWDSRYLWMPVHIGNGEMSLPPPREWSLDVKTGEADVESGETTSVRSTMCDPAQSLKDRSGMAVAPKVSFDIDGMGSSHERKSGDVFQAMLHR